MITIEQVIEQCAQLAEGWDSGAPIAKDIRALAAQYEGCIVAGAAAERERITQAAMLAAEKAVDAAIALEREARMRETERLAVLIAAAEREACAKVCEEIYRRDGFALAECQAADECAAAIRARSAK